MFSCSFSFSKKKRPCFSKTFTKNVYISYGVDYLTERHRKHNNDMLVRFYYSHGKDVSFYDCGILHRIGGPARISYDYDKIYLASWYFKGKFLITVNYEYLDELKKKQDIYNYYDNENKDKDIDKDKDKITEVCCNIC